MVAILQPLCQADLDALSALAQNGARGMTRAELLATLGHAMTSNAVRDFLTRVRVRGHDVQAMRVGYDGKTHLYRFTLTDRAAPAAAAAAFVTRVVSGDLGLGATPGARVSVPFVSFLDAAPPRAPAGRGEG